LFRTWLLSAKVCLVVRFLKSLRSFSKIAAGVSKQ
jgi:hypothetical protein